MDCARVGLEVGLCLELEPALLAGEVANFVVDDLDEMR